MYSHHCFGQSSTCHTCKPKKRSCDDPEPMQRPTKKHCPNATIALEDLSR